MIYDVLFIYPKYFKNHEPCWKYCKEAWKVMLSPLLIGTHDKFLSNFSFVINFFFLVMIWKNTRKIYKIFIRTKQISMQTITYRYKSFLKHHIKYNELPTWFIINLNWANIKPYHLIPKVIPLGFSEQTK